MAEYETIWQYSVRTSSGLIVWVCFPQKSDPSLLYFRRIKRGVVEQCAEKVSYKRLQWGLEPCVEDGTYGSRIVWRYLYRISKVGNRYQQRESTDNKGFFHISLSIPKARQHVSFFNAQHVDPPPSQSSTPSQPLSSFLGL